MSYKGSLIFLDWFKGKVPDTEDKSITPQFHPARGGSCMLCEGSDGLRMPCCGFPLCLKCVDQWWAATLDVTSDEGIKAFKCPWCGNLAHKAMEEVEGRWTSVRPRVNPVGTPKSVFGWGMLQERFDLLSTSQQNIPDGLELEIWRRGWAAKNIRWENPPGHRGIGFRGPKVPKGKHCRAARRQFLKARAERMAKSNLFCDSGSESD